MSTDQPSEAAKIAAKAVTARKIAAHPVHADKILPLTIEADKIQASEITATKISAAIPGHDEIRSILQAEGAPPRLTLDIGGSEDVNGDGLVTVSLGDDGHELVFEDA